jgi:hypothetical protein
VFFNLCLGPEVFVILVEGVIVLIQVFVILTLLFKMMYIHRE